MGLMDKLIERSRAETTAAQRSSKTAIDKSTATLKLLEESEEKLGAAKQRRAHYQADLPTLQRKAYEADLARRIGAGTDAEWQAAEAKAKEYHEGAVQAEAEALAAEIERDTQRAILELLQVEVVKEEAALLAEQRREAVLVMAEKLAAAIEANEALFAAEEAIRQRFPGSRNDRRGVDQDERSKLRSMAKLPVHLGIKPLALLELRFVAYADNGGRLGVWQRDAREVMAERPEAVAVVDKIGMLKKHEDLSRQEGEKSAARETAKKIRAVEARAQAIKEEEQRMMGWTRRGDGAWIRPPEGWQPSETEAQAGRRRSRIARVVAGGTPLPEDAAPAEKAE